MNPEKQPRKKNGTFNSKFDEALVEVIRLTRTEKRFIERSRIDPRLKKLVDVFKDEMEND